VGRHTLEVTALAADCQQIMACCRVNRTAAAAAVCSSTAGIGCGVQHRKSVARLQIMCVLDLPLATVKFVS
jgi:hypothetical protein